MRRRLIRPLQRLLSVTLLCAGLFLLGGRVATSDASVQYLAGWNLVAAPAGTILPADGSLYTLQPGDSGYETVPAAAGVQAGEGYWAYFSAGTTVVLPSAEPDAYQTDAPAGVWFLVGNPGAVPARLDGADAAYTYDPAAGYTPVDLLQPGRGAFVYVAAGGAITLTPAADAIHPVPIAAVLDPSPTAVGAATLATSSVQVLASGFAQSRAGGPIDTGVLIRNNSSTAVAQARLSLTAYSADGKVVAAADHTVPLLAAGETTGIGGRLSVLSTAAPAVRLAVQAGLDRPTVDPPPGAFSFSQIALSPGRGGANASALLTSSFTTDLTGVRVNALVYDAGGSIIGGGAVVHHLVPAGIPIGVIVPVGISGTPARVEFYAQLP